MNDNFTEQQYRVGYNVLGPVFAWYLSRLDRNISAFQQQHRARILFAARAGIRIRALYDAYLNATAQQRDSLDMFWISRFMVAKGLWTTVPNDSSSVLVREFSNQTFGTLARAIFKSEGGLPADFPLHDSDLERPALLFSDLMKKRGPAAQVIGNYLEQQGDLFRKYVDDLSLGRGTVALIDTGWQGTTQNILQTGFPNIDWWGLYVGRSYFPSSDRKLARKMIGVLFEADQFDPENLATSIIIHRHLIEAVLEPLGESVERLALNGSIVYAPESRALVDEKPNLSNAALYCGVRDYVTQLPSGTNPSAIFAAYQLALPKLAKALCFPTADDARLYGSFERSADFGRDLKVPTLIDPNASAFESPDERIEQSLWHTGQIALEYSSDLATARQRQELRLNRDQQRAILEERAASSRHGLDDRSSLSPAVAIIMRTMDRATFLRRALESVARQTFQDFRLVIVSDGGSIDPILKVVEESPIDKRKVVVVDNIVNRGMEAASNIGIDRSESEFVVIHDDDDSWHPDFLLRTIGFLRSKTGEKYGGVITHCWYVSEEVTNNGIQVRDRRGYEDWVTSVQIAEMACANFFAPISFVFRRSAYEQVGKFDESLPVLGDWDFNLRFLLKFDIGVITEKLSNYHHRDVGNRNLNANSVTGDRDKHAEYNAVVRNKFARLLSGSDAAGSLAFVTMAHIQSDIRQSVRGLHNKLDVNSATGSAKSRNYFQETADNRWVQLGLQTQHIAELQRQISTIEAVLQQVTYRADLHWVELQSIIPRKHIFDGTDAQTADRNQANTTPERKKIAVKSRPRV